MKILFFSDVHGICDNLKIIEKLNEKENFDKIVCLGDMYYSGPSFDKSKDVDSKRVLEFLTNYQDKLIALKGNCDSDVDIKASDFPIANLALICVDGLDLYLTHGNEYNKEKNRKFSRKGVLIYGHEHIPYIQKEKDMVYINVGSLSLPKNELGATYGIYESGTFTIYQINGKKIESIEL